MQGYRTLVASLVVALPGIMQAAGVLLIVLMIYAITGVYLFRDVVFQSFLNRHANFQDFTMAMVTLFRCDATPQAARGPARPTSFHTLQKNNIAFYLGF